MLCKLEWSWELRTWSHKMNLLDILSTSPHYFCWEWIGATRDNSNFDLRGLNGLMGWFFLFVMPWTWCELWWCRIYLCSLHSFPVFPDLLLKNCWCFLGESRPAQDQPSHINKNHIILRKNKAWASWAIQVKQVIQLTEQPHLIPLIPIVTNINVLLTIFIYCQERRLWELIKWSPKENALIFYHILSTHSLTKCIEISFWRICMWIWGHKGLCEQALVHL